jgi:hypothetical protein
VPVIHIFSNGPGGGGHVYELGRGTTQDCSVSGADFQDGAVCKTGIGVVVKSVKYVSSDQLEISLTVANDAPLDWGPIAVTNPDGTAATLEKAYLVVESPAAGAGPGWTS